MTGKRPRLYHSHQHQWTDDPDEIWRRRVDGDHLWDPTRADLVTCTVCGFTVPRNLANFDGTPARREDPIEMGIGPTETDIEESVARANRKQANLDGKPAEPPVTDQGDAT